MALAKMKRVFIVGLDDKRENVVRFLQEAGVVHVEALTKPTSDAEKQNAMAVQDLRRIGHIYESMKDYRKGKDVHSSVFADEEVISRCERGLEMLQEVRNRKQALEKIISDLSVWGDFDPACLLALESENVFVRRFRAEGISPTELNFPDNVFAEIVSEKPSLQFFIVSIGHSVELTWAVPLRNPDIGLQQAKDELSVLKKKELEIITELSGLAERIDVVKKHYLELLSEAKFTECVGALYTEMFLFGLQGWVPADDEKTLLDRIQASEMAIRVEMRDPLDEEMPPTLFKNNWFFKRIEPLLKLYGSPGYRDLDPSYFFAPFMILFFGICLGDAGYGAIFLIMSIWIRKRFASLSPSLPLVMRLCEAFSISAIIIGILTGSVFGYWAFSRELIFADIDKDYGDPMILFYASLGLGVIHLSLSYLMGIFQASSRIDQYQKFGLLGVLWGGACLISQRIWFADPSVVLGQWLHYAGIGFLACGVLLTFLFSSDSKKLVTRLGLGLWGVYGLTGLVGDLLSYARLFGLGIATTAIAAVMNDLAGMVHRAAGPVVGAVLGFFVLILGHSFNLALSVLGSTVHSARLHFVEAFKSFFRGGGIEYKPFKVERG